MHPAFCIAVCSGNSAGNKDVPSLDDGTGEIRYPDYIKKTGTGKPDVIDKPLSAAREGRTWFKEDWFPVRRML